MTKIRVYELAKEAGVDSKILTAQLKELGYNVKAYNSTLDEDLVEDIRKKVFGIAGKKVEEKRIDRAGGRTIIRRRTSTIRYEPESPQVKPSVPETEAVLSEQEQSVEIPRPVEMREKPIQPQEVFPARKEEPGKELPAPEVPLSSEFIVEKPRPESLPEPPPIAEVVAEPLEATSKFFEKPVVELPLSPPLPSVAEKLVMPVDAPTAPPPRKEYVKIIKKGVIPIPAPEKAPIGRERRPQPVKRPPLKKEPLPTYVHEQAGVQEKERGRVDAVKSKKGKRVVQIRHEAEVPVKAKKLLLAKRQEGDDVELEEVADIVERIPVTGLKVSRFRRTTPKKKKQTQTQIAPPKAIKRRIKIPESISVGDLARRMGIKSSDVIAKLMQLGVMATVNQALDVDTATLVAGDFGYEVEKGFFEEESFISEVEQQGGGERILRPPVVTVMGHVDHGKTSILDAIRKTDVAAGEAGGITQHIGAHHVRSSRGDVVFLDTPGHAAFTAMRARGAQVTDVVVLVVAADDGVMEQTKEAISHARAANVPIVVAINKIDKPNADPQRVKRELSDQGLLPEEWGGTTIYCEVSAKKNIGIEVLVENILIQSEILELKADPGARARGYALEAELNKGRGPIATVLIQQGTLRAGDAFVCGQFYGKVRSLMSDKGELIKVAGPSTPVEVQGISGVPQAGDEFIVVADEKTAKQVSSHRQLKTREVELASSTKISLEKLFEKIEEGKIKELRLVLRTDVQGTLEAFGEALVKLSTDQIKVRILHGGTGAITDSDILLASASDAIVIGFNVRPNSKMQDLALRENVDIRFYDVIYHAIDDIRKAMTGLLGPSYVEKILGAAEVRQTYNVPKVGTIAGCFVMNGKIERGAQVRLIRDSIVVFTGRISSLKRFKEDAREVLTGYECGIGVENYNDIKVGDILEVFMMEEIAATL